MTKQEYEKTLKAAYHLVYDDMVTKGPEMFRGHYDAENGNCSFMYGVGTVMEYIAHKVNLNIYDEFNILFAKNMKESEERA